MKVGSVVKLINPWSGNESYRNSLGIVLRMFGSEITSKPSCEVRFMNRDIPLIHHILTVYQHRLKVIKE